MESKYKIIKYGSKKNPSKKPKISQDQVAWLMMELETMRKYNEEIQNNQGSKTKSTRNS